MTNVVQDWQEANTNWNLVAVTRLMKKMEEQWAVEAMVPSSGPGSGQGKWHRDSRMVWADPNLDKAAPTINRPSVLPLKGLRVERLDYDGIRKVSAGLKLWSHFGGEDNLSIFETSIDSKMGVN